MPDGIMLWNMSDGLSNPFLPEEAGFRRGVVGGGGRGQGRTLMPPGLQMCYKNVFWTQELSYHTFYPLADGP